MNKQSHLVKILAPLVREFKPEKAYLFGSQARGESHEDSDYDILLVVPQSDIVPAKRMERVYDLLRGCHAPPADVFVYTREEFDQHKGDFNSVPEMALNLGKEIPLADIS